MEGRRSVCVGDGKLSGGGGQVAEGKKQGSGAAHIFQTRSGTKGQNSVKKCGRKKMERGRRSLFLSRDCVRAHSPYQVCSLPTQPRCLTPAPPPLHPQAAHAFAHDDTSPVLACAVLCCSKGVLCDARVLCPCVLFETALSPDHRILTAYPSPALLWRTRHYQPPSSVPAPLFVDTCCSFVLSIARVR